MLLCFIKQLFMYLYQIYSLAPSWNEGKERGLHYAHAWKDALNKEKKSKQFRFQG